MKNFFVSLVLSSAFLPRASAQDLHSQFLAALEAMEPLRQPQMAYADMNYETLSKSQKRLAAISNEVPAITNAIFTATANPNEEARVKVCQLTARVNDMFLGAERLEGYGESIAAYNTYRGGFQRARDALNCLPKQRSHCSNLLNRSLATTYGAYNSNFYDADVYLQAHGDSSYVASAAGVHGKIKDIECYDNGHTLKAKWKVNNAGGWVTFYFLDSANSTFVGSWGDESHGAEIYQGTWNARY